MTIQENYIRGVQQKRWPITITGIYPVTAMKLGRFKHTLVVHPKQWKNCRGLQGGFIVQVSNEIAGIELLQSCNRVSIYGGADERYRKSEIKFGWAGTLQYPLRLTSHAPILDDLFICWGTGLEIQRFSKSHNMIKGGVRR